MRRKRFWGSDGRGGEKDNAETRSSLTFAERYGKVASFKSAEFEIEESFLPARADPVAGSEREATLSPLRSKSNGY